MRNKSAFLGRAFVLTLSGLAFGTNVLAADCDVSRGERVAKKCVACHALDSHEPRTGPGLLGVVNRKAASDPAFSYSRALRSLDVTWTPQELHEFLAAPQKYAKGTSMAFAGISNSQDRADLICFLETTK